MEVTRARMVALDGRVRLMALNQAVRCVRRCRIICAVDAHKPP